MAGGMVAPRCSDIFLDRSFEFETPALTPLESTMNQLEVRLLKVSHLLRMMSLQTQRQANKMMNGLRKIVSDFVRTGEISDQKMAKLMDLTTKLEKLENQLMDAERARQIDPFELGRYLFTAEPILKGVEYRADLPGLGQVKIQFSKEVAEAFSRRGVFREMLFPSIFNGLVLFFFLS